jgi:hypothetical protein
MCLRNPAHISNGDDDVEVNQQSEKSAEEDAELVSCLATVKYEEGGKRASVKCECEDEVQGKLVQHAIAQVLAALGGIYV